MRKSDLVLLVLAVLALTATLVGALSGDRWTEERTVRFATGSSPLASQGPATLAASSASFNWTMPANATSAHLDVQLTFSGQAITGGSATVTLRVTAPDGTSLPPTTRPWAIGQGATSATFALNTTAVWKATPPTLRDTTSSAHGVQWDQPLVLQVIVQPPADLPLASYSFSATAAGTVATYAAQ